MVLLTLWKETLQLSDVSEDFNCTKTILIWYKEFLDPLWKMEIFFFV